MHELNRIREQSEKKPRKLMKTAAKIKSIQMRYLQSTHRNALALQKNRILFFPQSFANAMCKWDGYIYSFIFLFIWSCERLMGSNLCRKFTIPVKCKCNQIANKRTVGSQQKIRDRHKERKWNAFTTKQQRSKMERKKMCVLMPKTV